jgi:hypothetical protein
MLDLVDRQIQLVRVLQHLATVLPAVVGDQVLDPVLFVERQHAIVQEIYGRHRHLGAVQFPERHGAVRVGHRLVMDLAHALDRPYEVGVLADQVSRPRRLDVLLRVDQPVGRGGVARAAADARSTPHPGGLLLEPQKPLEASVSPCRCNTPRTDGGDTPDPYQAQHAVRIMMASTAPAIMIFSPSITPVLRGVSRS